MEAMFPEITKALKKFRKIIALRDEYEDSLEELDEIIEDSTEPLLVMVMGEFSTGKSTFINALVGEKIAAVNATPTTAVITKLCYGDSNKVIVHYKDGSKEEKITKDFAALTAENQNNYRKHDEISFVERRIPIDILKSMSIIDSPGLNSLNKSHTVVTKNFVDKADTVIWMFDANKPVSQTEITAMTKLNPRLKPIAIVNKMDDLNDDEDDETEFLEEVSKKLNDKVQRVIGISAKWAYMGKVNGNDKQLVASNVQEFYKTLDELVFPNIKIYKMNTLLDDITGYICNIWDRIETGESIVAGLEEEDYASYMEEREKQVILRDGLDEMLEPFYKYATNVKKKNASAQAFLSFLYLYGIFVEKDEGLAKKVAEEAALRNDEVAQVILALLYIKESIFDRALYWGRRLVEKESVAGMLLLGKMYQAGIGIDENAEEAVKLFERAAEQDDGDGIYQLACCYLAGYGVTIDNKKALELLNRGAKVGSTESMVILGNIYKQGEWLSKDEKEAFKLYEMAARKGDVDGQYELARCYFYGQGTEENDEKSVYWIRRAAMQDAPSPQYLMGWIYQNGYGVQQDKAKAIMWLNRAADNGSGAAMLELSKMEPDREKAFSLLSRAAEAGDSEAQLYLGKCYSDGNYVELDKGKALEWYKKSASQGNALAMNSIGYMYNKGIGVSKDYKEAMKWYKQSAESGNAEGIFLVGCMYMFAYGVSQNSQEAIKWFVKAAEMGYSVAMRALGDGYFKGDGVEKNYDEAVKWYTKAANEGDAEAMYAVGMMYKDGVGVSRDVEQAKKWLQMAVDNGNADAVESLEILVSGRTGLAKENTKNEEFNLNTANEIKKVATEEVVTTEEIFKKAYDLDKDGNYREAMNLYQKAASLGNAYSMAFIGDMYHEGRGVNKDYNEALKWFKKASEAGNAEAMSSLASMYYRGEGVKVDFKVAATWWTKASSNGDAMAKNNLAYLYEKGFGVQQSNEKAIELYKAAAAEGIQEAQAGLERLTSKSGCFITSAVCNRFNKLDDCYELTMFRKFRDGWLINQPDGDSLIKEYYHVAPLIVEQINRKSNSHEIYDEIWKDYLCPCLIYLESGENIRCKEMYVTMVKRLRKEFL